MSPIMPKSPQVQKPANQKPTRRKATAPINLRKVNPTPRLKALKTVPAASNKWQLPKTPKSRLACLSCLPAGTAADGRPRQKRSLHSEVAQSKSSYFSAQYSRLISHCGKNRATMAVVHSMFIAIFFVKYDKILK